MRFLIEDTQERTVYNALKALPNYIQTYGSMDAFLELYFNFHLSKDEIFWIINKAFEKQYVREDQKSNLIKYANGFTQQSSWN